jgi:hypothetical protein
MLDFVSGTLKKETGDTEISPHKVTALLLLCEPYYPLQSKNIQLPKCYMNFVDISHN